MTFNITGKVRAMLKKVARPEVGGRAPSFLTLPLKWFRNWYLGASIGARMTLAYLPLAIIIVVLSVYTLFSLDRLGTISRSIVNDNMAVIETADNLRDSLLAQESYGRRFMIMQSDQMKMLFFQRGGEFSMALGHLREIAGNEDEQVARLLALHSVFNDTYLEIFRLVEEASEQASRLSVDQLNERYDAAISRSLDAQLGVVQEIMGDARQSLGEKVIVTGSFSTKAFYITAFFSILGVGIGIGAAVVITRNVARSLQQLKLATAKFSERQFDFVPDLKRTDEFGSLAQAFTAMAQRLARLEVMDLDASPLTRLPGGLAIENILNERLAAEEPLAFCLLDIDNFKSFNDRYGYTRGNEVIKTTGKVIESAIARHGGEEAFLGHIGGDDFAVIIRPESYTTICESIIDEFDRKVLDFYDPDDRTRGYIISKSRQGETERFPIMTVSIAVVTNENRKDLNSIKMGEIAAEVKEHAKSMAGSVYLIDRRADNMLPS